MKTRKDKSGRFVGAKRALPAASYQFFSQKQNFMEKMSLFLQASLLSAISSLSTSGFKASTFDRHHAVKGEKMGVSKELLDILACPKCKESVKLNEKGNGLICEKCKVVYEIRDDIPIMLIDEAKPLSAGE